MNFWYSVVLAASLWTSGGVIQYDPIDGAALDGLAMVEMEATVGLGPFYASAGVVTSMFDAGSLLSFMPQDNTYIVATGLRLGLVDIGIEHECWHPMVPYGWLPSRSQVVPSYEGGGTRVYARLVLEGGYERPPCEKEDRP